MNFTLSSHDAEINGMTVANLLPLGWQVRPPPFFVFLTFLMQSSNLPRQARDKTQGIKTHKPPAVLSNHLSNR